jgi:hypothetical protein
MALNDLHFAIHRRAPWAASLFFLLAVGLVIYAFVAGENGPAIGAILPGTVAIALWMTRVKEIEGYLGEEGIVLTSPSMLIPYKSIRQIDAPLDPYKPLPPSFRINVHHDWGVLRIPDAPDINSAGIFEALISLSSLSGSRTTNAFLHPYISRHEITFGGERIWTFATAPAFGKDVHRGRPGRAIALAMLVTSLTWFAVAMVVPADLASAFGGLGGFLLIISLLSLLIGWAVRRPNQTGIKNWQESSIAITPVGLALIQGDVKGELLWDQLRNVKIKIKGTNYENYYLPDDPTERLFWRLNRKTIRSPRYLILVVEGATIIVPDFYDRPLMLIYDRILRYWKPEKLEESRSPVEL